MIDINGNNMDKTISQLESIAQSFDLKIEDREAINTAIMTVRERNKTVYVVTLLEALSKEGFEKQIFGYSIWKLVCEMISSIGAKYGTMSSDFRRKYCLDKFNVELDKWIK